MKREKFASQLGFLLTTAGCAIGLGNIYRFPYMAGQYGGALFVLIYVACMVLVGIPLVMMELAVGRASGFSTAKAFAALKPDKRYWKGCQIFPIAANYVYNMFYTTIAAQMLYYTYAALTGKFESRSPEGIKEISGNLMGNPPLLFLLMAAMVVSCFLICMNGLRNSVEKCSKFMLIFLFIILAVLSVHSFFLSGVGEGIRFYLYPDFGKIKVYGMKEIISAALGQAFFSLGIGAGSICICGSYLNRNRTLAGQAVKVVGLDVMVAVMMGLIIFPACFTYGVEPENGPNLLVYTMPNIFNHMPGGRIWGGLFFLAVLMAAVSTVIASFENIVGVTMDLSGWGRKKSAVVNIVPMIIVSLPCVLGMNLWNQVRIAGRDIMGAEDFMVSNILLPLGALSYLLFCVSRYGWSWKNFCQEANKGDGTRVPNRLRFYMAYVLPIVILLIFLSGFSH